MRLVWTLQILAIFLATTTSADNQCGISDYVPSHHRILDGTNVPPKKWPWLAAFQFDGKQHCGGSIISNRFILTAAHCKFEDNNVTFPIEKLRVFVGDVDKAKAQEFRLKTFHSHPTFLESNLTHVFGDIAIAELENEIKFDSNARPICLGKDFVEHNGMPAVIAGWGDTIWHEGQPSQVLKEGIAEFVENEPCQTAFKKPMPGEPGIIAIPRKEQQICAVGKNETDVWSGDSGGPLVAKSQKDTGYKVRWVQHGVVSFTTFIYHRGVPAAYTRVTKFCDWIKETTKGEAECVDY